MGGAASETPWACAGYDTPRVVDMFRAIDSERIDTLCAAGSNLPAVKAAAAYQRESGKPVITGNLALLEQLLRRAGFQSTVAPRDPGNR